MNTISLYVEDDVDVSTIFPAEEYISYSGSCIKSEVSSFKTDIRIAEHSIKPIRVDICLYDIEKESNIQALIVWLHKVISYCKKFPKHARMYQYNIGITMKQIVGKKAIYIEETCNRDYLAVIESSSPDTEELSIMFSEPIPVSYIINELINLIDLLEDL